jgi:uncharacterized protein
VTIRVARAAVLALACALTAARGAAAIQAENLPELTEPVNDFAHVIDAGHRAAIDQMIRQLEAASGDIVVVVTAPTIEPFAEVREYAVKLFENHGRGIGAKGKDNGVLILVAVKERKVWIEVGYGLEQWITDRFSGETSRQVMVPEFRNGNYGTGLLAGTARVVGRIAKARGVTLDVQVPDDAEPEGGQSSFPLWLPIAIFIAVLVLSRIGGGPGTGLLLWGLGPWSRWSSGVGPFGGGRGGGFGGGGFGGGFGGFGGGGSGGGGGGAGW